MDKNIIIKNLSKEYVMGKVIVKAVNNIDLDFEKGEFTVLAGPSGSGKTTVLNAIGGMDDPTNGKILVDNVNICELSNSEISDFRKDKLGFIFQQYNLIPVLTAFENIRFSLDIMKKLSKKEKAIKVEQIMEEMDILEYKKHRPDELSGGQQQRVAVARALVKDPEIILADEPTANLDSKTGETILQLMKRMNVEKNITFIFSSHDKRIIEFAKRVVWLEDGKIKNIENR
ncbi:MAG: ABC transporter ATP-binding protein [Candidatus Muirbacterium halophilum]|nr:ABC transporter ATP-binding protein [Candidatus Muirbacterium halophilum]MCK9477086.1 ABC transporter ATP-binding protein [Candidatus Muirbacterium halophilum]